MKIQPFISLVDTYKLTNIVFKLCYKLLDILRKFH